jgi:alpha-glucosidase (family GH31 glycosyl hydrolase)
LPVSATIDFSRPAGDAFWGEKVDAVVRDYGVDGFKYDAGEVIFLPDQPLLDQGAHPNRYPDLYARFGLAHRGVEMRAGFFSQHLPIAFRQFDKDSHFGLDNGLASVVTGILSMGMIGYPFVLPDMVGGNEYEETCDDELFIRWAELNAYLPMVQFSIAPWRAGFSPQVQEITHAVMERRKALVPYLLELADQASQTQLPMVRPLFFEFPDDPVCYGIGDQYLLGSRYLVAPVLERGARTRRVYLPPGRWKTTDTGDVLEGPITLEAFEVPLERIPVFERLDSP